MYAVKCTVCGVIGPGGKTPKQADECAERYHWDIGRAAGGKPGAAVNHRCPDCLGKDPVKPCKKGPYVRF